VPLPRRISIACFQRDGWKCRHCNSRNGLHPHHLIYQSHGGPDDLWNLLTLCAGCHRAHHDGFLDIEWTILDAGPRPEVQFIRRKGWKPTW